MAPRPGDRYGSARELAQDLDRYLDGRPVVARPPQYASTLALRIRPHREQIDDWTRLKLIYPHEATRLHAAYQELDRQEDDWIAASRSLSYSQIALYSACSSCSPAASSTLRRIGCTTRCAASSGRLSSWACRFLA
jgi:hypothetical protein